ncbi:MAG: hypothetical protein EAZ92_15850 [Candidatus Kapaibacterium sp.]|nr:MAG: hypothetical protein EAZ92_15850 [Candidatus Kapabacteria bacterium]
MPKLDEYYHLLRTQEPLLSESALRTSIRAAVERTHVEGMSTQASNSHAESNSLPTHYLESSSELASELSSHLTSQIAAETIHTASFLSGAFPLVAGMALLSALVVGVMFWQLRTQNAENPSLQGLVQPIDSTSLVPDSSSLTSFPNAQKNQAQERSQENPSIGAIMPESRTNTGQSAQPRTPSTAPIYDNTEELSPNTAAANDHANTHDHKHEQQFDVEMNEQERYRDSLPAAAHLHAKKRDATTQRRHDLLLLLVARTREHVVNPHHFILKGVPCSLPVAMKGETSPDCILTMLEQQSLLLHDAHLTTLIQQTRREKSLQNLAVLEHYIKEHY